jgi:predicted adenylyl cyclase CyaB
MSEELSERGAPGQPQGEPGADTSRNIELKIRLADLDAARSVAQAIATERLGRQHQVDTYFGSRRGRLKLREIDGQSAQLVWYARPDQPGPKPSDYLLVPVAEPQMLKTALEGALGIECVVDKQREIYLYENVRIHLDEVRGLGSFLEFEAVLGPDVDDAAGYRQLEDLFERFSLSADDLLPGSYGDMLR